jgi:hypothetical protein
VETLLARSAVIGTESPTKDSSAVIGTESPQKKIAKSVHKRWVGG